MLRFILLSILLTILFRALARLWAGIVRGMQAESGSFGPSAARSAHVPARGVQMVRDPICGTFVVPERAITLSTTTGERLHFCSTGCRDRYVGSRDHRQAAPRTA
ncbi:MAG: hypothetical protein AB7H96_23985 [Vicinamibacterales bacterium]